MRVSIKRLGEMDIYDVFWCNGSTIDFDSISQGSNP